MKVSSILRSRRILQNFYPLLDLLESAAIELEYEFDVNF